MNRFEKNGISEGDRVTHEHYPHRLGTITRCDGNGVQVRWDDGYIGELAWNLEVAYDAYKLQILRKAPNVPCICCDHLQRDVLAAYGVRCEKGKTGDQCSDFSCFKAKV